MTLRLTNTLTRTKEDFVPLDPKNVRMYVCGPTVYDYAHIGNARPVIVFDVLFRLLRHIYGPDHVTYVRNITDVDDKINARAAEEGVPIRALTERTAKQFHEDIAALGVLPPTHEPRATEHITAMIAMIEELLAADLAYQAQGHVLFDVSKKADYGKLAHRSLDEMIAGARVEVAPYKKGPMDFVLWKPSDAGTPGWESPFGRGRPGWHLECSAMSDEYLWDRVKGRLSPAAQQHPHEFDIHGGGVDLVFPHHENEIAQSEGAHHGHGLARYWLHNGFLQVEGAKMSKSLGNFVTVHELLTSTKFGGRLWNGQSLRLAMLQTHYTQPLDWTLRGLEQADRTLQKWKSVIDAHTAYEDPNIDLAEVIKDALFDDMNTPRAIAAMHEVANSARDGEFEAAQKLYNAGILLGFDWMQIESREEETELRQNAVLFREDRDEIEALIEARNAARKAKNFAEADRIRDELDAKGIVLKDGKDGTTWEVKR